MNTMKCPVCWQQVVSDATLPGYCKLCGMGLNNRIDFCCDDCESGFMTFSHEIE